MVFQDPMTSLNPVIRVARQLVEALLVHRRITPRRRAAGRQACSTDGDHLAGSRHRHFRTSFPGGMRQRVMLAMGFGNEPSLLIDEPTTALDVTRIQAQILDLPEGAEPRLRHRHPG
ncbi:MAG: hypothetical protein R3D25_13410 [Geminicoccaceae bacterium]